MRLWCRGGRVKDWEVCCFFLVNSLVSFHFNFEKIYLFSLFTSGIIYVLQILQKYIFWGQGVALNAGRVSGSVCAFSSAVFPLILPTTSYSSSPFYTTAITVGEGFSDNGALEIDQTVGLTELVSVAPNFQQVSLRPVIITGNFRPLISRHLAIDTKAFRSIMVSKLHHHGQTIAEGTSVSPYFQRNTTLCSR